MRVKVVFTLVQAGHGPTTTPTRSTHVARNTSNKMAALVDGKPAYGFTTLKSCIGLICYTRPDLIPSISVDYAVSVLDPIESEAMVPLMGEKVWEGMGMMSWLLGENANSGSKVVYGRLIEEWDSGNLDSDNLDAKTLEIVLELMPVSFFQPSFSAALFVVLFF